MTKTAEKWIQEYTEAHPPSERHPDDLGAPAGQPFTHEDHLFISPDHLARWIRGNGNLKTGPFDARDMIKAQGGMPTGISQRIPWQPDSGYQNIVYRFWRIPHPPIR